MRKNVLSVSSYRKLLLVGVATALIGNVAACRSQADSDLVFANIKINLDYPQDQTRAATCDLPASWLLRLDTSGDGTWEVGLLFDGSRERLFGCGGRTNICPSGTRLAGKLPQAKRVMFEGLSTTPEEYGGASSGIDVLCRGIADADLVPADIAVTSNGGATVFDIRIAMLRVGGSNPMPFVPGSPVPPQVRHGRAASFSNSDLGIGVGGTSESPRGRVVLAGGVQNEGTVSAALPNSIWEFSPQELSFSTREVLGTSGHGSAGLTATLYSDGGTPAVLLAGGSTETLSGGSQSRHAVLYRWGGPTTRLSLSAGPSGIGRSFHAAHYVSRPPNRSIIALVGSAPYSYLIDEFPATSGRADFEYFIPPGQSAGGGCSGVMSGFCVPSAATMAIGRGAFGSSKFEISAEPRLWLAVGQAGQQVLANTELFNAVSDGSFANEVSVGRAITLPASTTVTTIGGKNYPAIVGGVEEIEVSTYEATDFGFYRRSPTSLGSIDLKRHRAGLQATVTRDSSVIISGGLNSLTSAAGDVFFERLHAVSDDSSISSSNWIPPAQSTGNACDQDSPNPIGCVASLGARHYHTAIALEETQSWLDGAILIWGGADSADPLSPAAELFIPPMQCDTNGHLRAINTRTGQLADDYSNSTLPNLCDRDRASEPITDPLTGRWAD